MRISKNSFRVWDFEKKEMRLASHEDLYNGSYVMSNIGMGCFKHDTNRDDPNSDIESIYEDDIVKLIYEDPIKGNNLEAFGVITELRDGSYMIDFLQYETSANIPCDDHDSILIYGNVWDESTWENIDDKEFVNILNQWRN